MSGNDDRLPVDMFLIAESAEDRLRRVEEIRQQVAAGSYEVPSRDVADALVAFFSRDFVPGGDGNAGFVAKSC